MDSTSLTSSSDSVWIVDTDYSLDDQLALEYLINKVNIVAITVVGVNTKVKPSVLKLKIEDDLANKYGKPDIKVFAGADRPYINYQNELKDEEIFDPYNFVSTDFSSYVEAEGKQKEVYSDISSKISNIASVKIGEFVRTYEKKLNILTLGPLTNLSLAVLIDSTIRDRFDHLYIAGGSYNNLGNSGNCAEYNFRADPVAAKNVINYYKNITIIPLEVEDQIVNSFPFNGVTHKVNFNSVNEVYTKQEEEETRMKHSFLGFIAAIVVANPQLITSTLNKPTDVDIIGRFTRGALAIEKYDYLKSGKFNDVTFFENVDLEAFKAAFTTYIS